MLELRPSSGKCIRAIKAGKDKDVWHGYDDIVLDGVTIGICFRFENKIHWRFKKSEIPPSVKKNAIKLLQRRNERREILYR